MVMWFAVNRLKASNRYSMVPFSPKKGTPVETALVAEPGYVSVELKLARAVVQSVVVEAFANRAYSPHQAVVAFGLVPVVQQFDAARPKRIACRARLELTPLPPIVISMWLPMGFSLTPRSAVVRGKSVAIFAIWSAPVICVCTTVLVFLIQVWPSVPLRESG